MGVATEVLTQLALGAAMRMLTDVTLGLPCEVVKIHMTSNTTATMTSAVAHIARTRGVPGFWTGLDSRLLEGALVGAVLLVSKELIISVLRAIGLPSVLSAALGGAGGGMASVLVIAPLSGNVVAKVAEKPSVKKGHKLLSMYTGSFALALRQASNWATRQGVNEALGRIQQLEELPVLRATVAGCISCWNTPLEVIRITQQARAAAGRPSLSFGRTARDILDESGFCGLFRGLTPRLILASWATILQIAGAQAAASHLGCTPGKKRGSGSRTTGPLPS